MKKKKNNKKILKLIFIIIVIAFFATLFLLSFSYSQKSTNTRHVSEDLKISLDYPKGWYVDDKNYSIIIKSYQISTSENSEFSKHLKIDIDKISLCQETIEKNLIYGGCGENQEVLNKIISKDMKGTTDGILYKFTIQYPDNSQKTLYYIQNGERILQISKQPDPSQHEQEFEEIIESIRFFQ